MLYNQENVMKHVQQLMLSVKLEIAIIFGAIEQHSMMVQNQKALQV